VIDWKGGGCLKNILYFSRDYVAFGKMDIWSPGGSLSCDLVICNAYKDMEIWKAGEAYSLYLVEVLEPIAPSHDIS